MKDKEQVRDEVAGKITDKQLNELASPWLSMAEAPPSYLAPPVGAAAGELPQSGTTGADMSGGLGGLFQVQGYGQGSVDPKRPMRAPYGGVRLQYGRSF